MITIIDYGMGNHGSIANMLKKIKVKTIISSDPKEIEKASKLILPGVGSFDTGMRNIKEKGLIPVLTRMIIEQNTPVLGICLGMHLLAEKSEEGELPGLGFINGKVVRFQFNTDNKSLKIPHMGWNSVSVQRKSPLLHDVNEDLRFYFVHSYHLVCQDNENEILTTHHGYNFTSAIQKENTFGVQFHPEKSHKSGMKILENFNNLN